MSLSSLFQCLTTSKRRLKICEDVCCGTARLISLKASWLIPLHLIQYVKTCLSALSAIQSLLPVNMEDEFLFKYISHVYKQFTQYISYSIFTGHAMYTILILRLYSRLLVSIQPYDRKEQSVQIYVHIDCAVILHYSRLDEVCEITLLCYSMCCKWADVNTTSLPPWHSNIIVFCLCHPSFISS